MGVAAQSRDERVELAAKADAEGGVEERGDQGEPGGDETSAATPVANPTAPTTANTNPTSWANFSGGTGSFSVTGAEPRGDELREDQAVGVVDAGRASAPIAKTTACRPRMTAAATRLKLETISVMTR